MKKRSTAYFKAASAFLGVLLLAAPALAAAPNDPLYKDQWYLGAVGLPDAWNFAKGSPTVTVAVLDSGVDLTHPDLQDRIWTNSGEIPGDGLDNDHNGYVDDVHGWDFVDNDNDPSPALTGAVSQEGANHGTLVAGLIGAVGNNAEGISGVNWNVRILPLRVLDSNGSGGSSAVVAAVRYAIARRVQVINISFSGPNESQALADALRDAYKAGIVIVAAAGNEGDTERGGNLNVYPEYPVCYRGASDEPILIGVASLDQQGRRSSFSSYGSDCITVSAPGENIATTQVYRPGIAGFNQPYGDGWSGSSLAAPIVSGVAALLLSLDPTLTPAAVRALITAHAVNVDGINGGYGGQLGAGRIDAAASVAAVEAKLLGAPISAIPTQGLPVPPAVGGILVKSPALSSVYYEAADGKRYVFPNAKTYATWFHDFTQVKTISENALAALPLGGMITYRPGTRLIKVQTLPDVYAVGKGGYLRHIVSEQVAASIYGPNWASLVDDLPDAFLAGYRFGPDILSSADDQPAAEKAADPTIETDKDLQPVVLFKP